LTPSGKNEPPAVDPSVRRRSNEAGAGRAAIKNLFRIYLEKPELAGIVLFVLLTALFELRSGAAFLSPDNMRGILGLLPRLDSSRSV